jgi:hypothetical protein
VPAFVVSQNRQRHPLCAAIDLKIQAKSTLTYLSDRF